MRCRKKINQAASLLFCLLLAGCSSSASFLPSSSASATARMDNTAPSSSAPAVLPLDSGLIVTFMDVGQGDAALIQCDGRNMLIDGGEPEQSQKIYAILKEKKISHLDHIVCTHVHSDHSGGLSGALQYASCDEALTTLTSSEDAVFNTFLQQCAKHSVPIVVPKVGDVFALGSASFQILGPTDMEPSMDENDRSLVLKLTYGKTSFLFTGDSEQEEEQLLMYNEYDSLKADVLKASHHGSANGASAAWIKAIQPKITVISCGSNNDYGHPHAQTLQLLQQYNSALYRTDLQGDIVIQSDGTSLSATVARNTDAAVWQPGSTASPSSSTNLPGTYILNTSSHKFHYLNCPSVNKISAKNRQDYTGDRQDLIQQGYTPCSICQP
jgi:competence protein ComEC